MDAAIIIIFMTTTQQNTQTTSVSSTQRVSAKKDATPQKRPIIATQKLNVIYNQGKENEAHVLKDIDISIYPGEYIIIFGPSGCGKSTLLFSLSGLQAATSGTVVVDDIDISKEKRDSPKMIYLHRHILSTIFQAFHLIPSLNVLQNVELPSVFNNVGKAERLKKVHELLVRFGIDAQAHKLPSQLSGGQKQRVAISRALINDPKILFADEPVGNLDAKSADILLNILRDLNEREKRTIVLVTHDPRHLPFADRVFYMNEGEIVKVVVNEEKKKHKEEKRHENTVEVPIGGTYLYKTPEKNWKERDEYEQLLEKISMSRKQLAIVERKIEVLKHQDLDVLRTMRTGDTFKETPELRALKKSFRAISSVMQPITFEAFKIRQLTQYILSGLGSNQVHVVEDAIAKCYAEKGEHTYALLMKTLDDPMKNGGVGLSRNAARHITEHVKGILTVVAYLQESSRTTHTNIHEVQAVYIQKFFTQRYHLSLSAMAANVMKKLFVFRLRNMIDGSELLTLLDISSKKGGVGLHRRDAKKIAQDMEIIMLLLYTPEIVYSSQNAQQQSRKISQQMHEVKHPSPIGKMPTRRQ